MIRSALTCSREAVRTTAFSCLCKSVTGRAPLTTEVAQCVQTYLIDLMLEGTSDSRQQCVAALKHLMEMHFGRLYQSIRESTDGGDNEDQELICGFWRQVVEDICTSSLSPAGYFNKNDLSLSILQCLLVTWREKLSKCTISKIKSELEGLFKEKIILSLQRLSFTDQLRELLLNNTFDSTRRIAADLFKSLYPMRVSDNEIVNNLEEQIIPRCISRLEDRRMHIIDGTAQLLRAYCDLENIHSYWADYLVKALQERITLLDAQRPETLAESTLLGYLTAISMLRLSSKSALPVASLCKQLCLIVLDFVSHPSPEGHSLIADGERGDGDDFEDRDGEGDSSFSVMTFCWRAIKLGSATLSTCLTTIGRDKTFADQSTLLKDSGEFLVEIMMKIRHPGAFMSLAKPLRQVCQLCCSASAEMALIPEQLLERAMNICATQPAVQTTRRSAGLPVCITAIVSAVPNAQRRKRMLERCMNLEEIFLHTTEVNPFVIHNLNIIRQIFRDASLAADVTPFVPAAFSLCSRALTAASWAVRNSGLLLFVALMNRTFGIRHDAEDYAPVNFVDPRTIWAQYGCLFRSADDFADFAILQRYRYSSGGESRHADFYREAADFAWRRLGSERMKERRMAVRLLMHMCESPLLRAWILERVRGDWREGTSANLMHGRLSLVRALQGVGHIGEDECNHIMQEVADHFMDCYPIRMLVEQSRRIVVPIDDSIDFSKLIANVTDRRLNGEQIDASIKALIINLTGEQVDNREQILDLCESFWTSYDLEGSYRFAVVKHWHLSVRSCRQTRRICYLALTDDDCEIRRLASINFSIESVSVPALLRYLLKEHFKEVEDLVNFMPQYAGR